MGYYFIAMLWLMFPNITQAIIPPELIVSAGSSLMQILGLVALSLVSVYSVLQALSQRGVVIVKKHFILIVLGVNLLAGGVVYWCLEDYHKSVSELKNEVAVLSGQVAVLEREKQLLVSTTTNPYYPSSCSRSTSTDCNLGKKFYSENYVLVGEGIVLEIDANRIEVASGGGVFNHYTYLNGVIDGAPVTLYSSAVASTSEPVPAGFIERHIITPEIDLSTRATFELGLMVDGVPVSIIIAGAEGDFVTRDSLSYTRTQSVAKAEVVVGGVRTTAEAFVERTYSADASELIFFAGRESVEASTVQFIIWDEANNFYLYDVTDVKNPVPQYSSHAWLLKKTAKGLMQKSFVGQHQANLLSNKLAWVVEMPEFNQATFALEAKEVFKSQDGRIRVELVGTINDRNGIRSLHGIGHIVD